MLHGHKGYVTAVAFSPTGRLLATGGLDGVVRLWDLTGDRPKDLGELTEDLGEVQALAFAPDQPYLITGSANAMSGHMWQWFYQEKDPDKHRALVPSEPAKVDALAFRRDGKKLVAGVDTAAFLWSVGKAEMSRDCILKGHAAPVKAFAFSPDGKRLAVACQDPTLRFWEFGWFRTKPKALRTNHTGGLNTLAYAPNGLLLATGGQDGTVRLWDATGASDKPRAVLTGHTSKVRLVQFAPRGNLLVSVGDGGQVFVWDVGTQAAVREYTIDKAPAHSLALSPDGRYLAAGTTSDGVVSLYDLELIQVEQLEPTAAGI